MWIISRQRVTRLKTDFHNKLSIQLIWRNIIGNGSFVHASLQKIVSYKVYNAHKTKNTPNSFIYLSYNMVEHAYVRHKINVAKLQNNQWFRFVEWQLFEVLLN